MSANVSLAHHTGVHKPEESTTRSTLRRLKRSIHVFLEHMDPIVVSVVSASAISKDNTHVSRARWQPHIYRVACSFPHEAECVFGAALYFVTPFLCGARNGPVLLQNTHSRVHMCVSAKSNTPRACPHHATHCVIQASVCLPSGKTTMIQQQQQSSSSSSRSKAAAGAAKQSNRSSKAKQQEKQQSKAVSSSSKAKLS